MKHFLYFQEEMVVILFVPACHSVQHGRLRRNDEVHFVVVQNMHDFPSIEVFPESNAAIALYFVWMGRDKIPVGTGKIDILRPLIGCNEQV